MKSVTTAILLLGALSAGFTARPAGAFSPVNATYNGLFYETNGAWQQSSGILTVKTTSRGSYSAKLQIGKARYAFTGAFDFTGGDARDILRRFQSPLHVEFQVDSTDSDLLTGTVSDGVWTADVIADRAVFDGKTSVTSDQGRYTMVLLGDYASTNNPGGESFGTLTVDRAGRINFAGSLADGTKITQSSFVSKGGQWPFYSPLYGGWGSIYAWLLFNGSADEDLSGDVTWIRPEIPSAWYYPDGFSVVVSASGSRYTRPPAGAKILDLSNAEIQFNGGDLSRNFTNNVVLGFNNRIANLSPNGLGVTFSPNTGAFRGVVMDPVSWDWIPFQGVVLQNSGVAAGYFPGWDQSGEVWMESR